VEVRVQPDEQNNEQVPQHCGQVHGQEQGIEHGLFFWSDGEPQEDEFRHTALIISLHALLDLFAGNEKIEHEKLKLLYLLSNKNMVLN
jgi:hypothetical protein